MLWCHGNCVFEEYLLTWKKVHKIFDYMGMQSNSQSQQNMWNCILEWKEIIIKDEFSSPKEEYRSVSSFCAFFLDEEPLHKITE